MLIRIDWEVEMGLLAFRFLDYMVEPISKHHTALSCNARHSKHNTLIESTAFPFRPFRVWDFCRTALLF